MKDEGKVRERRQGDKRGKEKVGEEREGSVGEGEGRGWGGVSTHL